MASKTAKTMTPIVPKIKTFLKVPLQSFMLTSLPAAKSKLNLDTKML